MRVQLEKKAQVFLKNKLDKGIKSIKDKQKKLQEEENKIIQKKKLFLQRNIKKCIRAEK